jgi:hypothetical protein
VYSASIDIYFESPQFRSPIFTRVVPRSFFDVTTHAISTTLTESLEIEVPIVQAPIGSATCPELAASVANAGGLGMLAITWRDPEETRAILQETRQYTDTPTGVNIVVDENAKTVPTADHLAVCAEEEVDIVSFSFGEAVPYVDQVHEFDGCVLQTVGSAVEAASSRCWRRYHRCAGLGSRWSHPERCRIDAAHPSRGRCR